MIDEAVPGPASTDANFAEAWSVSALSQVQPKVNSQLIETDLAFFPLH